VHLVGQIPYCQHCHSVISLKYIQCMHINNMNAFVQVVSATVVALPIAALGA